MDISVPLKTGMVHWPDDPPVSISRTLDMTKGAALNVSQISMCSHTGTHMDAPLHFMASGKAIDEMPFTATIGLARVIEIHDPTAITLRELKIHRIRRGERLLFKTRNSSRCWQNKSFIEDFVYLSREAAEMLASRKVLTVGIDYLSVGGFKDDGAKIHRILLQANIWIIEGLILSGVPAGNYELLCLPLKLKNGDGAPARALLKPMGSGQHQKR